MNYLLFNNDVLMGDGVTVRRISKDSDLKGILGSVEKARLCVVDVDVLITASVEFPIEKKDGILVRKFKGLYQQEPYIIQDERLDTNLFQVIGIKEKIVREVYALIPSERVESFIPYGMALRNALIKRTAHLDKMIVFVDDIGPERLLTVLDGPRFSRTRVIANNGEDILPEIKRSQIDFFKKTEEFWSRKSDDFLIMVNNQELAAVISKNTEKIQVECLDLAYPALEGLKGIDDSIKYRLPEESIKKQKEIELKKRLTTVIISLSVLAMGLTFFLFQEWKLTVVNHQHEIALQTQAGLGEELKTLDKETYRKDLRVHKSLNYGVSYLSMLEIIPATYTVNSFRIYKTAKWNVEMVLFADDDGILDQIPTIKILKNAEIKDIFVNNQPGKHLRVTL